MLGEGGALVLVAVFDAYWFIIKCELILILIKSLIHGASDVVVKKIAGIGRCSF